MATVSFTQFLPEVMPLVSGCADVVAINAVRNATIDFCTRTLVWASTQDPVDVVAADMPMTLEAPSGGVAVMIMSVKADGRLLSPVTQDQLDNSETNWETRTGTPTHYFQPNPDEMVLFPLPQSATTLTLRSAYAPSRSSTSTEKFLYENYLEVIVAGALARLLLQPGEWSKPEMVAFYKQQFETGVVDAVTSANKAMTRAVNRVSINTF